MGKSQILSFSVNFMPAEQEFKAKKNGSPKIAPFFYTHPFCSKITKFEPHFSTFTLTHTHTHTNTYTHKNAHAHKEKCKQ